MFFKSLPVNGLQNSSGAGAVRSRQYFFPFLLYSKTVTDSLGRDVSKGRSRGWCPGWDSNPHTLADKGF